MLLMGLVCHLRFDELILKFWMKNEKVKVKEIFYDQ